MIQEVHVFLRQLWKGPDVQPVNMSPLCERLTTDIAGQLAFGQPLKTQIEDTNRIFPRAMHSMNGLVSIFSRSITSVYGRSKSTSVKSR
ncbi:hypothetical protein F4820DRAFT_411982 [Hypoxylon rubiginosum]|uniref:Uncharacterized protein n=1 Tax=Hypoxylon rubiginosum TaxID=110542 RepID=A0ACB9Z8B1_9PEZI|nr:hypothetical protein F4820DRAFT_411982 [Hypoxylon rubiginosum]